MKTSFSSLIIATIYSFCIFPVQAQVPIKVQGSKIQNCQSVKLPSSFMPIQLGFSNAVQQESFSSSIGFGENPILLNKPMTRPSYFQCKNPINIYSVGISTLGIGYGFVALHSNKFKALNLSTKNEIREDHPFFHTHIDNYLQFSPAAAVIGLNLAGVHGKHSFKDELFVYGISSIIMIGAVRSLKPLTHELRPGGSAYNSFPSGHTATAFAAAEWLRMEYGHKSPWIGVAGYAVATSIGVLRVYNNRHWVSDVVAGAAIGFLSTRIAYAVYPWIKTHIFHSHYNYTADF